MKDSTKKLAFGALATALVFVCTSFLKVPTGLGYIHTGDAMIVAFALVLGKMAILPSLLGSALADIVGGYFIYVPATILIKAWMAFVVAKAEPKPLSGQVWMVVLAEVSMVVGYFLYESILYGIAPAAGVLLSNGVQAAFGAVVGLLLAPVIRKASHSLLKENPY